MKKMILGLTVLAVAAAGIQTAKAGDREWAVAGKIMTGLVIASAINHAIAAEEHCAPVVVTRCEPAPCRSYTYCPPPPVVVYREPVYCAPAPRCYAPAPMVISRFGYGGEHHRYRHGRW